ncbi:MAG TPA: GNAT family N-acetyltransferase [Actinomycetota bacterium]|nr:GNAT family N-acetyltransferase [Actinomycetota bacterium]
MQVERIDEPEAFLDVAGPTLARDEARHNLLLGVTHTATRHREMYPAFQGWVVRDADGIAVASVRTAPFSAIVGMPRDEQALATLADAWAEDVPDLAGITGALPEIRAAADALTARTPVRADVRVAMGVYELTNVSTVPRPLGRTRAATEHDRELLNVWHRAFADDIGEGGSPQMRDPERIATAVRARLAGHVTDAGFWFWERDGRPVAMAGYSGSTRTGVRVGPVYTPSQHRGHGYATALVADLSSWLLAAGRRACFLYTDLANPTSNAIYERIGYRKICEALDITLTPRSV